MKSAKVIYWFGILLLIYVLVDYFVLPFDMGVRAVYEKLFFLYFISHPVLLVWLIADQIVALSDKSK